MNKKFDLNNLWLELTKIKDFETLRSMIYKDSSSKNNRYKLIADDDPLRFFELLGGDEAEAERFNWAYEYTYKDYINEYGINYNKSDEKSWDLENKSIENANDTGYYYVTGVVILKGLKGEKIAFELEYTDGYFDKIIGTPYDTDEFGNEHGIYFV